MGFQLKLCLLKFGGDKSHGLRDQECATKLVLFTSFGLDLANTFCIGLGIGLYRNL